MNHSFIRSITILGAGSWGTALALHLSRQGYFVYLWSIEKTEISSLMAERENTRYLPGFPFSATIKPVGDLHSALSQSQDVIIAVPSIGFRNTVNLLKPALQAHHRIICATKGMDDNNNQLFHEASLDLLGEHHPFAILSGPSFAKEVASGLPTALILASKDGTFRQEIIKAWQSDFFKLYPSQDIIGVEIGGLIKNIIAIAIGIADGLSFGTNMKSALITHGLTEMIRLGTALGGHMETFIGLSGLGDLILTCTDDQSRNRRLGLALGRGQDLQLAEQEIGQAVEGKRNARLVNSLAQHHQIDMPICEMIWQILQGHITINEIKHKLLEVL